MESTGDIKQQRKDKLRKIIRYTIAGVATVALLLIIIEGYSFYRLSPQRLYSEKYAPYENSLAGNANAKIEKAYKEKRYWDVLAISSASVLSVGDIFFSGLAYLETKNSAKAISSFQVVIGEIRSDSSLKLKDAAEYYLALAYLQNSDYDQAIELMNTIHNDPTHQYKSKFTRRYIKRVKRLKWR